MPDEITLFSNSGDLEKIASENPEYIRIYLNIERTGPRTRLWLTKRQGETLYAVSNRDYDDLKLYFASKKPAAEATAVVEPSVHAGEGRPKRTKQQTLLSFFNKKN